MQYHAPGATSGDVIPKAAAADRGGPEKDREPGSLRMSKDAFASGFAACARLLWCVAVGVTGSRDRAEDVVQDAAVVALKKLDEFEPGTSFEAWMAQIVRYVALNDRRKAARARTVAADPSAIAGAGLPAAQIEGRRLDGDLLAAIESLDETARSCLLLRVVMEMPYKEISLVLGVPEGTAMSHVHRSRAALRAKLTQGGDL